MLNDPALLLIAERVLSLARANRLRLATAESCTGGMIAAALTAIAGASDVFDRGFVTYSNAAKTEMLGVPAELIAHKGAVSEEVARAMAEGAIRHSHAMLAVSVTGIAGPGGGSFEKPVGLVWFGLAGKDVLHTERHLFPGDRTAIREAAAGVALQLLEKALGKESVIGS